MRFSALQEDGYGVDLGQQQLPDDGDESMMAATGELEPGGHHCSDSGSTISNLPLLFADGYPTSLEKITLPQLERFITFMVQCSFGHDTAQVVGEPQWWPKEVKFSNPFVRPKRINENWMGSLKKLVFRCYTYHRSEYLLRFCSYLAQYPRDKLQYVNNFDSTTSLYHKVTGKLLVTFRNENMNYDKKLESPRRQLLPRGSTTLGLANKTRHRQQQDASQTMVHPPSDDIYLCDNCDAEFVGLEKMKEHEKTCCESCFNGLSRPPTPDVATTQPQGTQNQFLEYFQLYTSKPPPAPRSSSLATPEISVPTRTSRRMRSSVNLTRCPTIPLSSPAGIAMAKKSKAMTEVTQQERLDRIERHMNAPPLNGGTRPRWLDRMQHYDNWIVTYKQNREKPTRSSYVHEYKFNSYKGKPVLSLRSQLLYMACRPIHVVLNRLTPEQLNELKRNPSKYQPPVRKVSLRARPRSRPRPKSFPALPSGNSTALGNESDPIVIDDGEATTALTATTITPLTTARATVTTAKPRCDRNRSPPAAFKTSPSPRQQAAAWTKTDVGAPRDAAAITEVIDLCSSDEDEDPRLSAPPRVSDENKDPRNRSESDGRPSYLRELIQGKLYTNPCVYPANSASEWLLNRMVERQTDNILNEDKDNCGNRSIGDFLKSPRLQYTPVLRPAP